MHLHVNMLNFKSLKENILANLIILSSYRNWHQEKYLSLLVLSLLFYGLFIIQVNIDYRV